MSQNKQVRSVVIKVNRKTRKVKNRMEICGKNI